MAAQLQLSNDWAEMSDPPKLSSRQWNISGLLGVVLLVMAVLQIISFNDFKDWFSAVGFGATSVWAVVLIVAEVWAAIGLFKLKLMNGFRAISMLLAILVGGFWFIENLRLVSETHAGTLANSGFFGKYLHQTPGWWTVIEVTVFLFWIIYSLKLTWPKK